jgi:mono/diheme cytochrome c family protein
MVTATLVKSGLGEPVQKVFAWIADPQRPDWQRSALLNGAEVALTGAEAPGFVSTKIHAHYPHKDYFYGPNPTATPPVRTVGFMLSAEPVAFATLASSHDPLAARAQAVLARVGWPGKPGMATVRPLTPEEQRRFDAGREVYRNICQACHQPDGRGHEKMAASLVGSGLALGPPEITARILMNGKEGSVGLMPPIGAALTDEQVADVLTYVRREWGQGGTPVTPLTVKNVRAKVAGRTRPWTNDELVKLGGSLTPPSGE